MKVDARIDLQAWERSIQKVHSVLKRKTLSQIINRSAGSIALKALIKTRKADAAKVRNYFNKVTVTTKQYKTGKKAGQTRTRTTLDVMPIAYGVYGLKYPNSGLRGEALRKEVKKMVGRILASISYLRHGWKEVFDVYRKYMKGVGRPEHRHKSGKRKLGIGTPAPENRNNWLAEAVISNRAVIKHEDARPMMDAAVRDAIREETAQLTAQAEKILAKDLSEVRA